MRIAEDVGYDFKLRKGTIEANEEQGALVVEKVEGQAGNMLDGKTVAVWLLTFKAGTDAVPSSPSVEIAKHLESSGATARASDLRVCHERREELEHVGMILDAMLCER